MKKVFAIVALMSFMFSTATVTNFKEKEKKKAKTEKACSTDKKDEKKSCASGEKKSCCSKK